MKNKNQEEIWRSLQGVAGITDILRNNTANNAFLNSKKEKISVDDIIEEEQSDNVDRDFTAKQCKVCGEKIESLYFWYNLKHEQYRNKSASVCSIRCLDFFREQYNAEDYEIIEHYRCSAYFECKEINNLRGKCEKIENKSYRNISMNSMYNFCDSAQAGIILSTHKLTEILKGFSKKTEQQYLSSKEMMDQGAKESAKQFKITTWMTILVIILTIANLVPTFLNTGVTEYSKQLTNIEARLSEMNSTEELKDINTKFDEVKGLIINSKSYNDERVIELLEMIQQTLK